MGKAVFENGTWGEIRTLNSDDLVKYMIENGYDKGLPFKLGVSSGVLFMILPIGDYEKLKESQDRADKLAKKVKTIKDITEM